MKIDEQEITKRAERNAVRALTKEILKQVRGRIDMDGIMEIVKVRVEDEAIRRGLSERRRRIL